MAIEFDPRRLRYVVTLAQAGEFLNALEAHSGLVVVDGETSTLSPYEPWSRIACLAFALPRDWDDTDPEVWAVALSHPEATVRGDWREVLRRIAIVLEDRRFSLVNQNLPFDLKWIRALTGIDLSAQAAWDTAMAARLLQDEGSVGLKTIVPKMFDIEAWDDGIDFHKRELEQNAEARATGRPPLRRIAERVPIYELMHYAAGDVWWTWRLAQAQQETFASWDDMDPELRQLGRLHDIVSVPTVRAMTRLSGNGLLVDRVWMADKRAELSAECEKVDQQITDLSGLDPCSTYEPSSKVFRDWADRKAAENLLRPVAVTKTGKISWSYSSLVANRQAGYEMADLLIQYRKASKQIQMLDSWVPHIGADGRVRPNYNLYRTVTGRLSSSDPNGQQLARVLKPMVIAPPGKVILEADLSQAEMRIAAFIAPCAPMREALILGRDLHLMIAGRINADKTMEAAHMLCLRAGLRPDREQATLLSSMFDSHGCPTKAGALTALCDSYRKSKEPWSGEGQWNSEERLRKAPRGKSQSQLEGRSERPSVSATPEGSLRGVRGVRKGLASPGASYRSGSGEQQPLELEDALRLVSQSNASILTEITGVDWKALRQGGKAVSFGYLFTMREEKFIEYAAIQYDVHYSYEEAVAARRAFFDLWEGLEQWHQRVEHEVLSDGYVVSPIGRIRRPAGARGDYREQYRAVSQATNAPVQGFVSDIMMISAGLITTGMPWITPVACVHDSFVFEVPEDRVVEAAEGVRLYMTGEPLLAELRKLGCELDVPLVADLKAGPRWGIGEEL